MTKDSERAYLRNIGPDGVRHARNKPFSDGQCGALLMDIGAVMGLLPDPPAKLLDLGCGTGWTSFFFAKRGYEVTGVDIAEDMISYANLIKEEQQVAGVSFIAGDYESLAFDREFDCVVFYDSLHHSVDERAALRAAYRALKLGGVCVASEPGFGHSKAPGSLDHMKRFGVTEKDMPPFKVARIARDIGFKQYQVFPHPMHVSKFVYRRSIAINKSKFLSRFSNLPLFRALLMMYLTAAHKHLYGLVVLTK